jgi:hypothetical protein
MQFIRPVVAAHPRKFGRGQVRTGALAAEPAPLLPGISEDVKLFAATFLAGFLFVSILIG